MTSPSSSTNTCQTSSLTAIWGFARQKRLSGALSFASSGGSDKNLLSSSVVRALSFSGRRRRFESCLRNSGMPCTFSIVCIRLALKAAQQKHALQQSIAVVEWSKPTHEHHESQLSQPAGAPPGANPFHRWSLLWSDAVFLSHPGLSRAGNDSDSHCARVSLRGNPGSSPEMDQFCLLSDNRESGDFDQVHTGHQRLPGHHAPGKLPIHTLGKRRVP